MEIAPPTSQIHELLPFRWLTRPGQFKCGIGSKDCDYQREGD
jgi:hypothetical protein